MHAIHMFLGSPDVVRLGWVLVNSIWQGAIAAMLLAAAFVMMRRSSANARYLTACGILLATAACLPLTWMVLAKSSAAGVAAGDAVSASDVKLAASMPNRSSPSVTERAPVEFGDSSVPRREPRQEPLAADSTPPTWLEKIEAYLPWLTAAWIAGVLVLSLRLAAGCVGVKRLRHTPSPAIDECRQTALLRLCRQLGIDWPVKLIDTALVEVPTVIGWLRPVVLWPPSLIAGLSVEQFEAILAHELAHIRRHDYLVNLLQTAIETLLFYHPAVWWISKRIRQERECCCDDLAIAACGDRLSYARALAALEERRHQPHKLALAADGGQLLARIRRIVGKPIAVRARNRHWILGFTLSVAVVAAVVAAGFSTIAVGKSDGDSPGRAAATNAKPQRLAESKPPKSAAVESKLVAAESKPGDTPVKNTSGASQDFMQLLVEQLGTNDEIRNGPSQKVADVVQLLPDVASVVPCVLTVPKPQKDMMMAGYNGWPNFPPDSQHWEFLARKLNIPNDQAARRQINLTLPYAARVLAKTNNAAVLYQTDQAYFGVFHGILDDRMWTAITDFMKRPPEVKALIVSTDIPRDNWPSHVAQLKELSKRIEGVGAGVEVVYLKPGHESSGKPFGKMEIPNWQVVDDATGKPIEHFGIEGGRADSKDPNKVDWGYYTQANAADSNGRFSTTIDWYGGWRERIVADGYIPQPILTKPPQLGHVYSGNIIRLRRVLPASKQDNGKKHAADQHAPASEIATTQRPYVIEPPDTVWIDSVRLVPKSPYKIHPLDDLAISVSHPAEQKSSSPGNSYPVIGAYRVEPGGSINLGASHGKVHVAGLTLKEAGDDVARKLRTESGAKLSIRLIAASSQQQIGGQHLIGPDGNLNFGTYGTVSVAGLTVEQACAAVEKHLQKDFDDPRVLVDVVDYASKVYYIIEEGTASGETVRRESLRPGNETVLDAIAETKDLPPAGSVHVWIDRSSASGSDRRLDVDWDGITKRGDKKTNYELIPGDRVMVELNKMSPPAAPPTKH